MDDETVARGVEDDVAWDPYRSLLRLAGGGIAVAADRVRTIEQTLGECDEETGAGVGFRADMESLVALAFGVATETPKRVAAAVGAAERVAGPALRLGKPLLSAMSDTVVGRMVGAVTAMTADEAARLATIGRGEIQRGRRLVGAVFDESVDGILDHLASTPALDELVSEQAFGVTRGAVEEVRESSAAADWMTESLFRRLLRRPARPVPPKPAGAV